MARREIQLRNRFDPHFSQAIKVGAQPVDAPRAVDRQFRMRLVLNRFANIDHEHIKSRFGGLCGKLFPKGDVAVEFVGRRRVGALGVAPHVVSEVKQNPPNTGVGGFFRDFFGGDRGV